MKYIDADKLKKIVEQAKQRALKGIEVDEDLYCDGRADAFGEVLLEIDTLQEEQPDFPTTDEQIKEFLATNPKIEVPEKYKNPDWLFKKQEQPEVDLEKEIDAVWNPRFNLGWDEHSALSMNHAGFASIARHFWNKGYNARKK